MDFFTSLLMAILKKSRKEFYFSSIFGSLRVALAFTIILFISRSASQMSQIFQNINFALPASGHVWSI